MRHKGKLAIGLCILGWVVIVAASAWLGADPYSGAASLGVGVGTVILFLGAML